MRFLKFLNEKVRGIQKIKNEIDTLKKSEKMGKLTPAGKKRLNKLQDILIKADVFDF